jgi:hypothetical protein
MSKKKIPTNPSIYSILVDQLKTFQADHIEIAGWTFSQRAAQSIMNELHNVTTRPDLIADVRLNLSVIETLFGYPVSIDPTMPNDLGELRGLTGEVSTFSIPIVYLAPPAAKFPLGFTIVTK